MILTDHLYAFTCAIFFRRSVFGDETLFNETVKTIADGQWIAGALGRGPSRRLRAEYLSAFTFTGEKHRAQASARAETARAQQAVASMDARGWRPVMRGVRRVEKLLAARIPQADPIEYRCLRHGRRRHRTHFRCEQPQFRYPAT